MRIVVSVKYTPDSQAGARFAEDLTTDRAAVDGLLSELDEYAVEEALAIAETVAERPEVVVLTVGGDAAADAVKRALQMGADAGYHVNDPAMHGSDAVGTSLVLAAALRSLAPDLVLTGMASTDGGMGVVPAMVAERLGWPQLTYAAEVALAEDGGGDGGGAGTVVTIRRDGDTSTETVQASLPAIVSVTDQINEPRYPSFKGIMAAKRKPVTTWSLADIGVDASQVGSAAAWTTILDAQARPPKQRGTVVTDDGSGAAQLVEFLTATRLV